MQTPNQPIKPRYKFYATLLDSFQWYLESDSDTAFQDMIDSLNRVKKVGDAAARGSALNALTDKLNEGFDLSTLPVNKNGCCVFLYEDQSFDFHPEMLQKLMRYIAGSCQQVLTKAELECSKGIVELYGYVDYVNMNTAYDLKGTSNYTFPKFLRKWQKWVYPYCLRSQGIMVDEFAYLITDYRSAYLESFYYNETVAVSEMQGVCNQLIDFIESNRHLITDQKVFALV